MRTIVIMQPSYLPWMGFFDLMDHADVFVIYDSVQFDKGGWRNRNRIKTAQGPLWLTVPVCRPFGLDTKINQVRISDSRQWRKKHVYALQQNYSRSPWFDTYFPSLRDILVNQDHSDSLLELLMAMIVQLNQVIGLERTILFSSQLDCHHPDRIERLIAMVQALHGDRFYEPAGGAGYFDTSARNAFLKAGIVLDFQAFHHPIYPQMYGSFLPRLSVVDLLFNMGPETLSIIRQGYESIDHNKNYKENIL